jgi:aldehyde:ferredoxin oxidoreductase
MGRECAMSRAKNILYVDLSEGKIETEPVSKYARDFIGGGAVGVKLMYDKVSPDVRGLDPENMITFNAGPLTGTLMGNKCDVITKSPKITNSPLVSSSFGGQFPSEMKFAGYEHLAITGKASEPVYLYICNDQVEIRSAKHLWGLDTQEVQVAIKKELKDPDVQIACIGPAGENQVVISLIIHDIQNAASGGGVGAVMGSKNLKAIAIRGTQGLKIANPEAFMDVWNKVWQDINPGGKAHPYLHALHEEGIGRHVDYYSERNMGQHAYGTGEDLTFVGPPIKKEELLDTFDRKYCVGKLGCAFCPIQCQRNYHVPGVGSGGMTCWVFLNMRYGVKNLDTKLWFKASDKAQRYGLDVVEITPIAGWLMLLYEKGIITEKDTDGIPMIWGNEEAILTFIDKVGRREGFGELVANGIASAAMTLADGKGFDYANQDRNISIPMEIPERGTMVGGPGGIQMVQAATQFIWYHPPFDRFGVYQWTAEALGISEEEALELIEEYTSDFAEKHSGHRDGWKPNSIKGKAKYTWAVENAIAAGDITGRCDGFSARTPHCGCTFDVEDYAEAVSAATGEKVTKESLLDAIQRKRLLEVAYCILCEDMIGDTLQVSPSTVQGQYNPIPDGFFKGQQWDMDGSEIVGEEYCEIRGCDPDTGIPTREELRRLGMEYVADKLEEEPSSVEHSGPVTIAAAGRASC